MKKKPLKEQIEALESEIEDLKEMARIKQERMWEIIQENDRLTLKYEPYRPPGDEHEETSFYDLIEENDTLTKNILDKIEVIKEVEKENEGLHRTVETMRSQNVNLATELREVRKRIISMQMAPKPAKIKKYGGISFDFWPPRDWFRFSYNKWHPGMAAQLCIGPIRIDWQAE